MHTPTPRTVGLRTTDVTYPGGAENILAVRADLRPVLRAWPSDCDCPKPFATPPARGSGHYRLPRRCALIAGVLLALLALLPAARLRVAPAAVRPGPQPGVVEPAPEQLAAIDDPPDADQPGLHDQAGAQRAVADPVAAEERLQDQAREDAPAAPRNTALNTLVVRGPRAGAEKSSVTAAAEEPVRPMP